MKSEAKLIPRLELHFEYRDMGPVLTKTFFVENEDSAPKRTEYTDETRVQWRAGAMALMWFFIKSKLERGSDLTWLACEPNTLMGSVHESVSAKSEIKWHTRVFGMRQLRTLIKLTTHLGKPLRCLNTEFLPQDRILVYVDGDGPVDDDDRLLTLADNIEDQWAKTGGKQPAPTKDDARERAVGTAKSIGVSELRDPPTVLEIDLVGYTHVAYILEESIGPDAVGDLNKQIQSFIDVGLAAVGCGREQTVKQTTGDGAILVFNNAIDAHNFAETVHNATEQHNANIRKPEAKRRFRIGAATGKISLTVLAGVKIIEAVRFESCARAGELVIDRSTYQLLTVDLQAKYQPEESVCAKDETFWVRRCAMAPDVAPEGKSESDVPDETLGDSIFEVPYQENPYFTGRDEQLAELRTRMTEGGKAARTQAICGLGGIGKTQLAVHYAFVYRKKYRAVFWVRSDTQLHLTDGFFAIAQRLELPHDESKREDVIPVVKHWLASNADWLVIFDNADTPLLLKGYLPNVRPGHTIVTSRASRLDSVGIVEPIELPKLLLDQATDFLLKRTGRKLESPERKFAESLSKDIDGLPLALEQAGAYILAMNVSFERYLANYRQARDKIEWWDKQEPVAGDYDATVATTWMVNFKEVEKESSASADLLRLSSFLDPDCIPFELIIQGASDLGPALHGFISKSEDPVIAVAEALERLARFSLVHVDPVNEVYSMHRLVQEVLKARDET